MLWSKIKKLHRMSIIKSFYIAGESTKNKVHENSTPSAITHVNDLEYHFPDLDLSTTFTSNSGHERYAVLFLSCIRMSLE